MIEIAVQDNITLGEGEVFIKRQDGMESNMKPVQIEAQENCTTHVLQTGTPLYSHPYASTNADKGLVASLAMSQILKPIEWGENHKTNEQWLHVVAGTYQGWISLPQTNIKSCPLNLADYQGELISDTQQDSLTSLNAISKSNLSSSWAKVLRGELEYVSTNKSIRLVKYKNSFPPIYTPNGTVHEGERMYVIKLDGDFAQVMTDEGKVGWIDKTYLNIDPSPYIGMMLFPLAGDDENKILATQEYGWSEYALAGLYDGGKHEGIDLVPLHTDDESVGKGCNAPTFSARSGKIAHICKAEDETDDDKTYNGISCKENGNLIIIDHGEGLTSSYAHLNSIESSLYVGKEVSDRDLIGYTGNTGAIKGDKNICHLDFGVWQDGVSQNPYRYFRAEGRYLTEAEREELNIGELQKAECKTLPDQGKDRKFCIGDEGMFLSTTHEFWKKDGETYTNESNTYKRGDTFTIKEFHTDQNGKTDVLVERYGKWGMINLEDYANSDIGWMKYEACKTDKFNDVPNYSFSQAIQDGVANAPDKFRYCEFRPDDEVTRAAFAKIITNGLDIDESWDTSKGRFNDVPTLEWFAGYVYGLVKENLVTLRDKYRPSDSMASIEALKILLKHYNPKFDEHTSCYTSYLDAEYSDRKKEWYKGVFGAYLSTDILEGKSYKEPTKLLTRYEMVDMIYHVKANQSKLNEGALKEKEQCVEIEGREFKTSISSLKIRQSPNSTSEVVTIVLNIKAKITVTGTAVDGEYIDAYKTHRWYPVVYEENGSVYEGYVLATLLHISKFAEVVLDDNFVNLNLKRSSNTRITGLVLHTTVGNGTAVDGRNALRSSSLGTQYYVDRDGKIAQSVPDYKFTHHAGYHKNGWTNVLSDGSDFTIGIEIAGYGPLNNIGGVKKNVYGTVVEDTLNVKESMPQVWQIWSTFTSNSGNITWAGRGENINEKTEYWQKHTDKQLETLVLLIDYLEERYGLPKDNYFEYSGISNNYEGLTDEEVNRYSHYYFPRNVDERIEYNRQVREWKGIFQHHNMTGKFDAGIGLDIDQLIDIRKKLNK